jgi:hypothetical protein
MPQLDVFGPLPRDPELTRLYDMVPGETPLDALYRAHADGLGPGRVRLVDGRIVFEDPADQLIACGLWRIVACSQNGAARRVELIIPPPVAAAA